MRLNFGSFCLLHSTTNSAASSTTHTHTHTHTHTTHSQTQSAKSKTVTENKAVELTCHARSGSWVGWLGGCGWVEATLNIRPVAFNASDSSSTPANYSSTSPDHHHSKLARSYLAQPLTSDDEPCNQQLRHLDRKSVV